MCCLWAENCIQLKMFSGKSESENCISGKMGPCFYAAMWSALQLVLGTVQFNGNVNNLIDS